MTRRALPALGAILIADDHEVFRFGLAGVLRAKLAASRMVSVGRFDEAIALISDPDLELAIIDLRIPGLEVPRDLTTIRQLRPGLRVLVLSGSDAREDILAALAAGVHGYLVGVRRPARESHRSRQLGHRQESHWSWARPPVDPGRSSSFNWVIKPGLASLSAQGRPGYD